MSNYAKRPSGVKMFSTLPGSSQKLPDNPSNSQPTKIARPSNILRISAPPRELYPGVSHPARLIVAVPFPPALLAGGRKEKVV